MTAAWAAQRVGDVLKTVVRQTTVDPSREYRLLGVRLDGLGPFHRETLLGTEISATKLYEVKRGDFIYSRLFAWRGAFGLIDDKLDGHFVSGEFPTFTAVDDRIDARFLAYWFRLPSVLRKVEADCSGSTPLTRNRFKREFFLSLAISLPPLDEQRRIVRRIEELARKAEEARRIRSDSLEELQAFTDAFLRKQFIRLSELTPPEPLVKHIVDAAYGTSHKSHTERARGDVPILRIPNVASERIDLTDLKYGPIGNPSTSPLTLVEGDVLIVRTNGSLELVGRSAVVPKFAEPTAYASYLIRLRFDTSRVIPEYAQIGLRYLRRTGALIDMARTTAGQYNVSLGRLRNALLPIPAVREQERLIIHLQALEAKLDDMKKLQAETAVELDAMLPTILDKAFKGEL